TRRRASWTGSTPCCPTTAAIAYGSRPLDDHACVLKGRHSPFSRLTEPAPSSIREARSLPTCAGRQICWRAGEHRPRSPWPASAQATYGPDGFRTALPPTSRRGALVGVLGATAEAIVSLYASCDRRMFLPQLGRNEPPRFRDRFTQGEFHPESEMVRQFVEL